MESINSQARLTALLSEMEDLLKTTQVGTDLGRLGVNTSLALVAVQGLNEYIRGEKARAAEDFRTVADEIDARLRRSRST